ncbi:hypothetical protein WL93_21910 [Burkholderia diffusa]|nr:hypothetical protein WL93_21910 [Burkholderia diffusa]
MAIAPFMGCTFGWMWDEDRAGMVRSTLIGALVGMLVLAWFYYINHRSTSADGPQSPAASGISDRALE